MRKNELRRGAAHYLRSDRTGPYRNRAFRHHVIHKVINDLFVLGTVPPKWHALNQTHLKRLVIYWQKKNMSPVTIMKYMTVIRSFLHKIEHSLTGIDNQSLGLFRKKNIHQKETYLIGCIKSDNKPHCSGAFRLTIILWTYAK